jgi:hypothetical protein
VKDDQDDDVGRVSGEHNAPIGHSWELIDRRVIELWLGSQSGVSLPRFGPTDELRAIAGAVKPGT